MKIQHTAFCAALLWGSCAYGTVVFQTGFESYSPGSALTSNGWALDGSGTAAVGNTAGLARSGSNYAIFGAASTVSGSWSYRTDTSVSGAALTAEPVVTIGTSLALFSPASGTADRTTIASLLAYNTSAELIGGIDLIWDPEALVEASSPNHYYVSCYWYVDTNDTVGSGFSYDLGPVTSSELSTVGYWDLAMQLNYATGDVTYYLDGIANPAETTHGTFAVTGAAGFQNFGDADYYFQRTTTGGTMPRIVGDDYFITSAAIPEPAALSATCLAGLTLLRRRRNG